MLKGELNDLLKQGDKAIEKIKEQQKELLANYISKNYQIEKGDKLLIQGMTVVVVGFDVEGSTHNIKLRYKRIKYSGALDNVAYYTPIKYYENLGKYNGRL